MNLELSSSLGILQSPIEMRSMTMEQLKESAQQVRQQVIKQLSSSGRHLPANLVVVDLAIALHHLFNSPYDKVLWDIGYQNAAHKIITGQHPGMTTKATTKYHNDNVWELFDDSHAGSTLSAASGLAEARDLLGKSNHVVCVIDDVSLGSGLTLESLMQIGASASKMIVIINHIQRVSPLRPNALVEYFERIASLRPYHKIKSIAQEMGKETPDNLRSVVRHAEDIINNSYSDGELFEQLGFLYTGPLDGNEISQLIPAIKNIRDREEAGPVLIHVITDEAKAISQIGAAVPSPGKNNCGFLKLAVKSLHKQASIDSRIVFISSHNVDERPLSPLKRDFTNRFYDFPISDQHAVSFATGLACEGLKPIVFMRSAFFTKCADQIINDVAMQSLPVRFVVDGAGLSAQDGPKYAGVQDVAMLSGVPNINVMAPADDVMLVKMLGNIVANNDQPSFLKIPDATIDNLDCHTSIGPQPNGKGRVIKPGNRVAILSFGIILQECLKAHEQLSKQGIVPTVADACFANPLDEELLMDLASNHDAILCVEEGPKGGFCASVSELISRKAAGTVVLQLTLDEDTILRGANKVSLEKAGITAAFIIERVQEVLQDKPKLALAS